jgi:hypothetical protein
MSRFGKISILIAAALAIISCTHKELCYHHRDHAHRNHINIIADYRYDWEECYGGPDWEINWPEHYLPYDDLRPGAPSGLRVVNYNQESGYNLHNIPVTGGVVNLYEGINDILLYNNDTEYIVFSRSADGISTRATTRTRTRASFVASKYSVSGENTINPPDMLYANYIEGYYSEKVSDPTDVEITLQPLVFTYMIRFEFKSGLEYVSMARGALSGMAESVQLNTGETSEESATILFDAELTDYGVLALVNSFGVPGYPNPNYPTKSGHTHGLNLEILLRNGRTLTVDYNVTEQIQLQPHGGVIVIDDIEITEDVGQQGSGAFDVTVDEWGEYEDIVLPL